jgi:phage shock protein A
MDQYQVERIDALEEAVDDLTYKFKRRIHDLEQKVRDLESQITYLKQELNHLR